MSQWNVRIEATHTGPPVTEDQADAILTALEKYAGVISAGGDSIGATFAVKSRNLFAALANGYNAFNRALTKGGIKNYRVVDVELQPWEDYERSLDEPANSPDLVGVSEVAEILSISRQRASELADSADFPKPIAHLAAGPIWRKAAVMRYVGRWPRKVGRPPKKPEPAKA